MTEKLRFDEVRDSLTFRQALPCHPEFSITMQVEYRAFDSGFASYLEGQVTMICPACFREYVMANIAKDAITRRLTEGVSLERAFDDIRATLRKEYSHARIDEKA